MALRLPFRRESDGDGLEAVQSFRTGRERIVEGSSSAMPCMSEGGGEVLSVRATSRKDGGKGTDCSTLARDRKDQSRSTGSRKRAPSSASPFERNLASFLVDFPWSPGLLPRTDASDFWTRRRIRISDRCDPLGTLSHLDAGARHG